MKQPDTRLVLVSSLNLSFQPPDDLDDEAIHSYVQAMRDGKKIEPIEVYSDGATQWLADGFHRVAAAKIVGIDTLMAIVKPGTLSDMQALLAGISKDLLGPEKREPLETEKLS